MNNEFTDTFEMASKREPHRSDTTLWLVTALFGFIIYLLITFTLSYQRHIDGTELINLSTAWTAVALMGLSMILSGVCYFWNTFDHYIFYRKHLGVIGFAFVAMHAFFSLVLLKHEFPFPTYYLAPENIVSFVFALISFLYFVLMTAISNKYAVHEIGGENWRRLLRIGFIAYIFAIIHFGVRGLPWWIKWIQRGMPMPPPLGLVLFIFALFVPYFRVILEIALRKPKSPAPQ